MYISLCVYNIEDSSAEGDSDGSGSSDEAGESSPDVGDIEPTQATGKDREFLLRVENVAEKSNDPETKVQSYHAMKLYFLL